MPKQLALDLTLSSMVNPDEQELFLRWINNLGTLPEIAAEYGKTETEMIGIIAKIWRKI